MSVAGDVVEGAVRLIGELFALRDRASEAERQRIDELLDDAQRRLRAIKPNAPRIRALIVQRRRELEVLEEEERRRRQDEDPTGRHELPGAVPERRSTLKTDPDDVDRTIDPATGMQREYLVLSAEERAQGFVRPVRDKYLHLTCGTTTTMGTALAETYARNPSFYSGTFCARCRNHFPVGADGQFVWDGTEEKVGT